MGSTYKVLPFHLFSLKYTTPQETPQGLIYDVNYQAFEEFKNIVLAPVTTNEIALTSLPYIANAYNYEVKFSIPADLLMIDNQNQLLETPKINFFADYERMYAALNNTEIHFYDGTLEEKPCANLAAFPATGSTNYVYRAIDTGYYYLWATSAYMRTGYKANLSMSEPSYLGKEEAGGGRIVYSVRGVFQISDWYVGTGNDTKIALYIKNSSGTYVEYFFNNKMMSNIDMGSETNANANQTASALGAELDASNKSQNISFTVADIVTDTDLAMQCVYNKAKKHATILSTNETNLRLQKKVRVRVYDKTTLINDFWAVLSATWSASGATSYSSFSVTLTNDEKGV